MRNSSSRKVLLPFAAVAVIAPAALVAIAGPAAAVSSDVVISQVYGGGGNSGAPLANDFIELYNTSSAPVSLSGWSVAYFSATTGNTGGSTSLTGTIAAHSYYLIQEAAGTGGGGALPTPDTTGNLNLSAASGRVDLLDGATLIDRIGYGSGAQLQSEGAPAPGLSNTVADTRSNPPVDTDNNSADFTTAAPAPHGSTNPGTDLPEAPMSALLLVGGLGAVGTGVVLRRRRRSPLA
jgi:LPXTG-motif cell wall-anchored protein